MSSGMISGIFNYCDRWCERCQYTSRCRLFAMDRESFPDAESRDPQNAAFWEALGSVFEQTKKMILQMARERGIDLSNIPPELDEAIERRRRRSLRGPAVRDAHDYAFRVRDWLKANAQAIRRHGKDLVRRARMELPGDDPKGEALRLTDALEVIQWYQFQIAVKLRRASCRDDEDEEEDIEDEEGLRNEEGEQDAEDQDEDMRAVVAQARASDSDGSAKVALLGIDRSLAAWGVVREALPELADEVLDFLVQLDRLRRAAEAQFPRARAFVRPGFDTGGE